MNKKADANRYYSQGEAFELHKEFKKAKVKFRRLICLTPDDSIGYAIWGNSCLDEDNYEEANRKYQKATILKPTFIHVYNNWGNSLSAQCNYEEANRKYE